ncbi:MAG: hypothetical protein ACJAR7_000855 [Polaromonas sp.]|jgi:hypothetical protein
MRQKLRRCLLSLPFLMAAGFFAIYLGVGFFGVPALLKWQGEKRVHEALGQNLAMADVRFNPLLFKLEVGDLALADEQGQSMLGFQRLLLDFELWRSVLDQTWTFAKVSLDTPKVRLEIQQNGRHNFSAMLDKLSGADAKSQNAAPWPRLAVQQLAVTNAQIDVSDLLLAEPLITRIAPLTVAVDGLSTVSAQVAQFRLTAPTALGESLSSEGSLTLRPLAIKGQLALKEFQVNTLTRALSRLVTLDAQAGKIATSFNYDVAVAADNQIVGELQDVALNGRSLKLGLVYVAQINLAAQSLQLTQPDGPLELTGDGLSGEVTQAVLNSPKDGSELVFLGRSALAGGTLHQQQFKADTLTLAQGHARTWRNANGQFNLLGLFDKPPSAKASSAPSPTPVQSAAKTTQAVAPWRFAVKQIKLDDFDLNFEDQSVQPPLALRLSPIKAQVTGLDSGSNKPVQLTLQTALVSGGTIQVDGTLHATTGVVDLQLKMSDIALAPVQSYLSRFAALQLATGKVSSHGRLRYGDPQGAGAQLVYEGQLAVKQLLLKEVTPERPFLSWDSVGSNDVLLTLSPNRLDIAELQIEKPSGRLFIAADRSVNLTDVLKRKSAALPATPSTDFPISIARVRVADGMLAFSDASMRPQFDARMLELKGVITGISNAPDQSAKVQLDARVEDYGSAKIGGQISLLSPEKLTDINMAFSNLELSSLSPYTVKFAGYRIAGGRLWLDLQYRVKDSKLQGKNKVLLRQVVLGEKVESPGALNLPLELAIAVLTDSDGVIDIALPVSGDLNDPQFDYGAIIGKAVGNLLGSIVTAPFRAIAALFGEPNKTLDNVIFEPGKASLAPPEQQKLAAIARALKERPALKLVVPLTSSETFDTPVLKSLAVRREIVTAMGLALVPGEDPGPVDAANARTQKAVDIVFNTRYTPTVLAALKERDLHAAGTPATSFYQGLIDKLMVEQSVSNEALAQLAAQRSDAILTEMTQTNGMSAPRTSVGQVQPARDADGQSITLQLQLEVTK